MNTLDLIKKLCNERNISLHKLEVDLGFGNGSLTKAKSLPFDRVVAIAEYFNIKIDYFLSDEEPPIPLDNKVVEKAMALYSDFQSLSPENQTALLTLLKSLQNES